MERLPSDHSNSVMKNCDGKSGMRGVRKIGSKLRHEKTLMSLKLLSRSQGETINVNFDLLLMTKVNDGWLDLMGKSIFKQGEPTLKRPRRTDWQANNTASFSTFYSHTTEIITTIWIWAGFTWEAGLKRKEQEATTQRDEWVIFAVTRERMDRSPHLSFLSPRRRGSLTSWPLGRQFDKLCRVLSLRPCTSWTLWSLVLYPLLILRENHRLEKTTDTQAVCRTHVPVRSSLLFELSYAQ